MNTNKETTIYKVVIYWDEDGVPYEHIFIETEDFKEALRFYDEIRNNPKNDYTKIEIIITTTNIKTYSFLSDTFTNIEDTKDSTNNKTKKLIANKAQCLNCGEIISSMTVHDFKTCSCGNLSVDGGLEYAKRSFIKYNSWVDMCEYK